MAQPSPPASDFGSDVTAVGSEGDPVYLDEPIQFLEGFHLAEHELTEVGRGVHYPRQETVQLPQPTNIPYRRRPFTAWDPPIEWQPLENANVASERPDILAGFSHAHLGPEFRANSENHRHEDATVNVRGQPRPEDRVPSTFKSTVREMYAKALDLGLLGILTIFLLTMQMHILFRRAQELYRNDFPKTAWMPVVWCTFLLATGCYLVCFQKGGGGYYGYLFVLASCIVLLNEWLRAESPDGIACMV